MDPARDEAAQRRVEQAEANRHWQEGLLAHGFDVGSRLAELELQKSRWHMDFTKGSRGRPATVQEQLGSKPYVRLQANIHAERENVQRAQRALDRVSSFDTSTALLDALEAAGELQASRDKLLQVCAAPS